MKLFAIVCAALALACFAAAGWIYLQIDAQIDAGSYQLGTHTSYRVGDYEADGSGIGYPVVLLLGIGAFCARYAWNLWRDDEHVD